MSDFQVLVVISVINFHIRVQEQSSYEVWQQLVTPAPNDCQTVSSMHYTCI